MTPSNRQTPLRLLLVAVAAAVCGVMSMTVLYPASPTQAQGADPSTEPVDEAQEPCAGGGDAPDPTPVEVEAVPIVVTSTTADYFVLYVVHDVDGTELAFPVLVKRGEAGTTTLAENIEALPAERYRVEKYLIAEPADVDGDCIDDITELASGYPLASNPVNAADGSILGENLSDGAVGIPDQATFNTLASELLVFVLKATIFGLHTNSPGIYFLNTNKYRSHNYFAEAFDDPFAGFTYPRTLDISYNPNLEAPDGSTGAYFWDQIRPLSFGAVERTVTLLAATAPAIADKLYTAVKNTQLESMRPELHLYEESRIILKLETDLRPELNRPKPLNEGIGYGLLRVMEPDERPQPRDVVIYEALPNELPRVAGVITSAYQTPLSHVNLRATQNQIPNAYIPDAVTHRDISRLIGSYVRYEVNDITWNIRKATPKEVEDHYAASRPAATQTPERDLSVTAITPLSEIGFEDWTAFGVKAVNVAVLGTLGFADGTVPDGFAIPFYFYDKFMNNTALGEETVFGKGKGAEADRFTLAADKKLIDAVTAILAHPKFQTDFEIQDEMLDDLRDAIEDAQSPQWIIDALTAMHAAWPDGQSLRYRSSTNNEDLPNFNGAGLYDSKTQNPDETEEDGIDKSLKGVFAGLWTFRAFTEREFHRIDHTAAAMGVLVHPNYSGELANGVALSLALPYEGDKRYEWYYVNAQLGEDLVTNPEALSKPEELVVNSDGRYQVLRASNLVPPGTLLMSDAQILQLRKHLEVIHNHFKPLYAPPADEPFAMEIEFKITSENILAIKQARPWVFGATTTQPDDSSEGGQPPAADLPDNQAPQFLSDQTTRTVPQSQATAGYVIPMAVVASDPEADTLSYELGGDDAASFAIDASGQLQIRVDLDPGTYSVTVTATDPEGASGTIEATITVTSTPTGGGAPPAALPTSGGGGGGSSGPTPSDVDFEWNVKRDIEALASGHDEATGMWSDGVTMWIAHNGDGADDAVFAYDLQSGERVAEREFDLAETNRAPRGVWSDGETIWIADSGRDALFAHDLESGERLAAEDFALADDNADPRGIWSDGETLWVLDGGSDALFAYEFESGELLAEYALAPANGDPHGLFFDGVTFWVSDHGAKRLFAYRLEADEDGALALERNRDEEFPNTVLSRAGNNSPRGIWSVGDVMYVADASDSRVYSYNMPDATDARLASLTLSGVEIGEFDPGRPDYEAVVADGVTETTVEAVALQRRTSVSIDPSDTDGDDTNGYQIALAGVEEVTVTVSSADASRTKLYRVRFAAAAWDPARDPWPHCLRGAVSEGFSLVVFAGGSVDDLVTCAESRDITALYALHEGVYAPYILGAPEFVNRDFSELFAGGLPVMAPLVAGSNGPPSPDPFGDDLDGAVQPWAECLRGAAAPGLSLAVYEGGSVGELVACAESRQVTALYALHGGEFVPYIAGAPEFVNQPFHELYRDGLPRLTPLILKN